MDQKFTPRAVIGTPWFLRKAIYLIVTLIGLVAVVMGWVAPGDVDEWLTQVGSLAAVVGGGMAAMNTGKASDETPAEEIARTNPETAAPVETLDDIRDRLGEGTNDAY